MTLDNIKKIKQSNYNKYSFIKSTSKKMHPNEYSVKQSKKILKKKILKDVQDMIDHD